MSKMLMLWLVLYGGGLMLAIIHPFYPLFAYLTFYYMPPHLNWWGAPLPELRYSLTASLVLLVSIVFLRSQLEEVKDEKNQAFAWLLGFGANSVIVTAWALNVFRSWIYTVVVLKLVLLYALIPAAVRTPARFDAFGMTHVVGAFYWGYKAWDNPKRDAGRLVEVGGPDTQNDNEAASHLLTVLPFAALYVLTGPSKVRRLAMAVAAAFIVNVFILCNSRGATVGLIVAGLSAVLLIGKGRRKKMIGVGIMGVLALLYLADPEFIERQQTTTNPTDNSAQGRIVLWRIGIEIFKDHPFGGGGRTFHLLSPRYMPAEMLEKYDGGERSPHSVYLQLITDWGVQGAFLFAGFMFMTFRMLHQIRKRAQGDTWYIYRSLAIETALIGALTSGVFAARLYGESTYWMCALAFALYRVQSTALEAPLAEAARPAPVPPERRPAQVAVARGTARA
jgi:hypothetical protein